MDECYGGGFGLFTFSFVYCFDCFAAFNFIVVVIIVK